MEVWKEALNNKEKVKESIKNILNLLDDCDKDPPSLFSSKNQKTIDSTMQELHSAITFLESCTKSKWALHRISAIRSLINKWYLGFLPWSEKDTFNQSDLVTLRKLARRLLTSANNIAIDMDQFKVWIDEPKTIKRSIEEFIIDHAVGFVITIVATLIATLIWAQLF